MEMIVMNNERASSSSRFKLLVLVIGIAIIVAVGVKFYLGYRELKAMDHKIANLKQDVNQLQEKKKELKTEIERVNSKEFVKQIARKKLGLIKEGEILYITVEED